MSRNSFNIVNVASDRFPAPLSPAMLRAGLSLAVLAAIAAFAIRVQAQPMVSQTHQTPSFAAQYAAALTNGF